MNDTSSASTGNVTGWWQPVDAVHHPSSVPEVVALVAEARRRQVPLYPVSTGLNWGYGSRSPVLPGAELLNLSRMNRILNADAISSANPVAVIEPGVTQGQLHDFLARAHPELTFNVTGSGIDSSILGNALDRGSGYLGPRSEDLFGFEWITGTGEVIRTGFRRLGEASPLAHCHPFGLGPMLDGLCLQSNLAIVTSACLRLRPRRPVEAAVSISLDEAALLPRLIDELARLKREGLLAAITHLGNPARSRFTLRPGIAKHLGSRHGLSGSVLEREVDLALSAALPHSWTGVCGITGNAGQVRAAMREIRQRLAALARVRLVTDARLDTAFAWCDRLSHWRPARVRAAALAAVRPLHALATGHPSDVAVQGLLGHFGESARAARDLDHSRCGLIYINPALPLDGRMVSETVAAMERRARDFGHELYVTVNLETGTSLVAVANLLFDRSVVAETDNARRCADALVAVIRSRGLEVYRARTDMMEDITGRQPEHWRWITALKQVFDPDQVIAPGRYCPPARPLRAS